MSARRLGSRLLVLGPISAALAMGACTSLVGDIGLTGSTGSGSGAGAGDTSTSSSAGGAENTGGNGATGGSGGAGCKADEKMCDGKCAPADPAHGCNATSCDPCPHDHGDVHCVAGACEAFACDIGYKDCNGMAADGCETNTSTDPLNCGSCAHMCPQGMQFCGGGQCSAISCVAPLADCNGLASDQCEVDTSTDAANCGACNHVCGSVQGTGSCTGSTCQFACSAGYQHCSTNPADDAAGCDVDIDNDVNNCGACGHQCATQSGTGTASCSGGVCQFACTSPYVDCGTGHDQNGCNVSINDPANCGGCGIACSSYPGTDGNCVNAKCECKSGYTDNDGNPGCEAAMPNAVPEAGSLQLWLKGDYGFVAGNIWKDQSGNGRDANPWSGTVTTTSLNGRQALSFQGAELLINTGFPAWSGATVFAVQNTTTANALIAFGVSYNPGCNTSPPAGAPNCVPYDMMAFGGFGGIGLEMCDGNIGSCFQAYDAALPSGWFRTIGMLSPNVTPSYRMFWNGADRGDEGHNVPWPFPAPWATPRRDTIIGWNGYRGMIAEIIVFNTALSDASRAAIDAYLSNKWGI